MSETLNAIYEDGVFKPLQQPHVRDGEHVRLVIEPFPRATPERLLELAAEVYTDLSEKEIAEVEAIATDRRDFFHRGAA